MNRLLELQAGIRNAENAQRQAEELARQQAALYNSVQEGVQRAFADGLNAVATGEGGIRESLKNAADAIRSALSNAIAGSLTDSFLGMLGGKDGVLSMAGKLGLGGSKRDGSNPANAIYTQDVNAAPGALVGTGGGEGDGVVGGVLAQMRAAVSAIETSLSGVFSGVFDHLRSMFSAIRDRLSSVLSGVGSLFSGGGSAGGLLQAARSLIPFAEGGYTGSGGKYQPAGVVHAGEYVFNAAAVRRVGVSVLDNLHAIASGSFISHRPRPSYAEGGLVNLPAAAPPNINVPIRNINVFDTDQVAGQLGQTRAFERAVLNVIQLNPSAIGGR